MFLLFQLNQAMCDCSVSFRLQFSSMISGFSILNYYQTTLTFSLFNKSLFLFNCWRVGDNLTVGEPETYWEIFGARSGGKKRSGLYVAFSFIPHFCSYIFVQFLKCNLSQEKILFANISFVHTDVEVTPF